MTVRVVVADQGNARFYDIETSGERLRLAGELVDPKAHLHNRDLVSDRPGRVFDHASPAGGRRGAVAHHGTGGERSPRKHEAQSFARQIAEHLQSAQRAGEFDRIVVMAGPAFLGVLRGELSRSVQAVVAAEIHKDLVHQPADAVLEHLPRDALRDDRTVSGS